MQGSYQGVEEALEVRTETPDPRTTIGLLVSADALEDAEAVLCGVRDEDVESGGLALLLLRLLHFLYLLPESAVDIPPQMLESSHGIVPSQS